MNLPPPAPVGRGPLPLLFLYVGARRSLPSAVEQGGRGITLLSAAVRSTTRRGVSTCQPLPSTAAVNLNFCPSAAVFLPRAFPPVVHTGVSAGLPPTYCTSEAAAGRTGAAAVVDHPYPWDGSQHPTALFRPLPVDRGQLPLPPFCVFSSRRPLCSCGPCRALQAPVVASSEPRARSSVFGTTRGVAT